MGMTVEGAGTMPRWRPRTWVLLSVTVAFNLFMFLWLLAALYRDPCPPFDPWECGGGPDFIAALLAMWEAALVIWVLGDVILGVVWFVSGRRHALRADLPTDAGRGRAWRVPEPGAALWDSPRGFRVLARLAPGTTVVEVERQGERIKVTTLEGAIGWVECRSVA